MRAEQVYLLTVIQCIKHVADVSVAACDGVSCVHEVARQKNFKMYPSNITASLELTEKLFKVKNIYCFSFFSSMYLFTSVMYVCSVKGI